MKLPAPSDGQLLLTSLPSFGKGDSNSLFIWVAFLRHFGDVFGDGLLRFAFGKWHNYFFFFLSSVTNLEDPPFISLNEEE